jgi:hypothetical protein
MVTSISVRSPRAFFTVATATAACLMSALTPAQVSAQATCPCFSASEIVKKCGTTQDWESKDWKKMRRHPDDRPFYKIFNKKIKFRADGWWYPWGVIDTGTLISCSRWRFLSYTDRSKHSCMSQKGLERGSHRDYWGTVRHNHLGWKDWNTMPPRTTAQGLDCKKAMASALKTLKSVNGSLVQKVSFSIFLRGKTYWKYID